MLLDETACMQPYSSGGQTAPCTALQLCRDHASRAQNAPTHAVSGWVRIQRTDVIRTTLISILMAAKLQRLEVVRGGALTSSVIFPYPSVPAGGAGQGQGWENFVEL